MTDHFLIRDISRPQKRIYYQRLTDQISCLHEKAGFHSYQEKGNARHHRGLKKTRDNPYYIFSPSKKNNPH